ncbi:HpcH/HpaI aldolase family protein [Kribbella sp. ALI-6-A]|uniref:HpcH/HpaI aldolase family protein n=1 Tax=Kribbella sp. ALI-6-A TaxID=1933817 RepID=UPI00143DBAE4|nr:aldolase/citrate lyase family protein [Kribbella sp. ALI-6-A]
MATPASSHLFLDRLRDGNLTMMMGLRSARTPDAVRIARATGHEAVMIDLEHSSMSIDVAAQLAATAADLGILPFVRIPEREYGAIGRLLDGGAQGIIAPRVETAEEARLIARACRFAPRGQRSQLAMVPQLGMHPLPATELNPRLDDATVVVILVETPIGVANAEAIAAVDGVDLLAIGANDLSAELGIPGRFDHPRMYDAVATVAEACRRHGKLLMLGGISDVTILDTLMPLGICPLQLTGTDSDILYSGAQSRVERISTWFRFSAHATRKEDQR